jgi:hypothetical protein
VLEEGGARRFEGEPRRKEGGMLQSESGGEESSSWALYCSHAPLITALKRFCTLAHS